MAVGAQCRPQSFLQAVSAFAAAVTLLAATLPSQAVVVESLNAVVPRPPGAWVGSWNGSSAVPVGQYWVLSARHVGGGLGQMFVMRGQQYQAVEIRQHESQDLELIRVATPLAGWHEIASPPTAGTAVVLGGCGATTLHALPGGTGWDWSGPHTETWGRNVIESAGAMLRIRFDAPGAQGVGPQEAAFAINDSGAGLFVVGTNGVLQLAGTAVSVSAPGSSAYGVSCYSVGLHSVRDWINSAVAGSPEHPVTCDLVEFLTLWFSHDPLADLDHDLDVDIVDLFAFLTEWYSGC